MQPIAMSRPATEGVASAAPSPKLRKAAQQFEGLLINTLLGPMEKTFSSLPGQKDVPGDANYAYLATQALASALAAAGGLGIARMIVRNVMNHQAVKDMAPAKVPASAADKIS